MAMRRFEIAQESMLPNLRPGDEVVAVDGREPRVGDMVVFPHPAREDFWVVKRVGRPPHAIGDDEMWVVSDNPEVTRADSRTLGSLPRSIMWTVVERLDAAAFAEACDLLAAEDGNLSRILDDHGLPEFWVRPEGFSTLVWLILEQQVSLESGAAMFERLHHTVGTIDPGSVSELGEAGLRDIGVTRQKAAYLTELAARIHDGAVSLEALTPLSFDEARAALLEIRGVGPWTADAYLLSALRHPDAFPVGDRALQVGSGETLGMTRAPDPDELEILSRPWRPIRAAAARIIWHGYLSERGRTEPADPRLPHASVYTRRVGGDDRVRRGDGEPPGKTGGTH